MDRWDKLSTTCPGIRRAVSTDCISFARVSNGLVAHVILPQRDHRSSWLGQVPPKATVRRASDKIICSSMGEYVYRNTIVVNTQDNDKVGDSWMPLAATSNVVS